MSQALVTNLHAGNAGRAHQRSRTHTGECTKTERTRRQDKLIEESDLLQTEDLRRAERVALRRVADDANAQRQRAVADQRRAAGEFAELLALAYAAFLDFRDAAHPLFTDHRDRAALGLAGRVPVDARGFVKTARVAYRAALVESRLTKLAQIGYDAPVLQAALDNLKSLLAARQILVDAMSHTAAVLINYANAEHAVVQTFGRNAPARTQMAARRATLVATE